MDMTYREKSAWGSLVALGLVSVWYFPRAFGAAEHTDDPAGLFFVSIACIVALIVIEAVYHAVIAVKGGEATDERDTLIDLKSERIAGYALAVGLFWLVGRIVATTAFSVDEPPGPLLIAVWILFALTASEFVKLLSKVCYYRADA